MYKFFKKLGMWVVTLESNEKAVQFSSMSRKRCSDWVDANEVRNEEAGAQVWSKK